MSLLCGPLQNFTIHQRDVQRSDVMTYVCSEESTSSQDGSDLDFSSAVVFCRLWLNAHLRAKASTEMEPQSHRLSYRDNRVFYFEIYLNSNTDRPTEQEV